MASTKGAALEELVRAYFARQGYFTVRSVPFRYEGEDVTDLDVWLYARHSASARLRGIVDVKNKRSPKAFERVLWVKGLQLVLNCDRAFVATTDANPTLVRFAAMQKISVLSKGVLDRLEKKLELDDRYTLEEFVELINSNQAHKQDGDWLRVMGDAKSAVASLSGFPAFNKAIMSFLFFAERAEVRMKHRDIAVRCSLMAAALACIALDGALDRYVFEDANRRFKGIEDGVMYGDAGDGLAKKNLESALVALSEGLQNGKAIAAKAREQLSRRLEALRADVIAEYFTREPNAQHLFAIARELEGVAHSKAAIDSRQLSLEARSTLGIFADFCGIKRSSLPIGQSELLQGASVSLEPLEICITETLHPQQSIEASLQQGKLL